jgi:hypothetical protein
MSIATELELINLKLAQAEIMSARVTDDELTVDLADGRTISVPVLWFPRLAYGTPAERDHFEIKRQGIHWPDLDEDVSVRTLLLGRGLGESRESLEKWLLQRKQMNAVPSSLLPTNGDHHRQQPIVTH